MATHEHLIQFDRLEDRLLRGGIAPRHVRRTLTELREHYDDALRDEQAKGAYDAAQAAWQRLGTENDIAQSVLARRELHALSARFPRAVFGAGPLVLWFAITALSLSPFAFGLNAAREAGLIGPPGTPDPVWFKAPFSAMLFFYLRILPVIIGAIMVTAAARQRLALGWAILGTGVIALLSAFATYSLKFATAPGEKGELTLGFGVTAQELPQSLGMGVVNMAIVFAAYMLWQRTQRRTV